MKLLDDIHENYVTTRRVAVLAEAIAEWLPPHARVLDVGCGTGLLSSRILARRPDLTIQGVDVLVREPAHIPVASFDGRTLPFADGSFDVATIVDVLHHTDDPTILLREALRVTKDGLVVKDHTRNGLAAGPTLRFMDWVGNARHGVALPYNYWPERRWRETFRELGLEPVVWRRDLAIYPWWSHWLFGRSLHFLARLTAPRR